MLGQSTPNRRQSRGRRIGGRPWRWVCGFSSLESKKGHEEGGIGQSIELEMENEAKLLAFTPPAYEMNAQSLIGPCSRSSALARFYCGRSEHTQSRPCDLSTH